MNLNEKKLKRFFESDCEFLFCLLKDLDKGSFRIIHRAYENEKHKKNTL